MDNKLNEKEFQKLCEDFANSPHNKNASKESISAFATAFADAL